MTRVNGLKAALEALQGLDEKQRSKILADITKKDPALAKQLQEGLFEFSDLQYMLKTDFQVLWWEVPKMKWHVALRKTPAGVMKMIQSFLTKRAFDELTEEIQGKGPQPLSEVLKTQKEIIGILQQLAGEGKVALPSKNKNDPMV